MQDMDLLLGANNLFNVVGRNPVTIESIAYARTLTNHLVEPGINIFVKYLWNY